MHVVLTAFILFLTISSGATAQQMKPLQFDRTACVSLDETAVQPVRSLEIRIPDAAAELKLNRVNVNVLTPHKLAATNSDVLAARKAFEDEPRKVDGRERAKIALALGCTFPGYGEYVSYKMVVANQAIQLPVADGTQFPLAITVCGESSDKRPVCLYGTVFESWETGTTLYLRSH